MWQEVAWRCFARRRRSTNSRFLSRNKDGEVTGDLDEQIGVTIVKRALEEPLRQIVQNAGKEGAVIVKKVRTEKEPQLRLQRRD